MTAGAEGGPTVFELSVLVHEGKHFPSDTSFEVNGVFDEDQQGTGFTRLSTAPVWSGPALTWRREAGAIKKLQAQGAKLKLTVSDDHRRLGWVVVDIRTMKQNALEYGPEGDNSGVWLDLQSPTFKTDKGESSPCIRVFATLREAPVRSTGSGLAKTAGGSLSDSVAVSDAPEYDHGISPRSSLENAAHNSVPPPVSKTYDEVGAETTPSNPNAKEQPHLFTLTADVRSFKATRRLPFPTAMVVVKLTLPETLTGAVDFGGKPKAAAQTPVRTNPPASVTRASEVTLGNGYGCVDFGCGVMALATVLAQAPRVVAEVWHKDQYTEDVLLGTATVSLAPLLREPTLDGYAPVMSDADSENPGAPRSALLLESEAVKVGELRVVLSLAEKGPLPSWAAATAVATSASHQEGFTAGDAIGVDLSHSMSASRDAFSGRSLSQSLTSQNRVPSAVVKASTLRASMERATSVANGSPTATAETERAPYEQRAQQRDTMAAGAADSVASMDGLRQGREYAVAWELEVWKQAQEAKWTASMRARESERMTALEGEWRRREAQREAEHRRVAGECVASEKALAGALAATQERERRLVAAEESLSVRREAERREMAQRMSEAQHAVRRLQQECEHQLEMEKGRTADCERRAANLESRVEEANARSAAVEHAFHGYKRAHLESSEATLHTEIATLQQRRSDAEQTARDAVKSRDRFKTQIQKMAKQVVALERERTYLRAALSNLGGSVGGNSVENAAANGNTQRLLRGLAPPKPAPSVGDFAEELFGGGGFGFDSQRTRNASNAFAGDGADPFLREFRESVALLEREARGVSGGDSPTRPVENGQAEPGQVPFVPAGVAKRSPSKSSNRSPQKTRPGDEKRTAALDSLRSRDRFKSSHATSPETSTSNTNDEVSKSVDSESGLLALFESAKEFEEAQRLEMETEKENTANAEAKLASLTAAAEENRKNAETKLAHLALEAESNKKKAPITAASLAEKRGLEKQVRRLVAERAELMATGAYSSADRVISLIDEKIAEMTNAVARG